jgi:uncharacterized FlgJ-related protein
MFYTYNRKDLEFKRFKFKHYIYFILCLSTIVTIFYSIGRYNQVNHLNSYEREFIIYLDQKYFSEENLIKVLQSKNINKPHIVLAQAKLETQNFTSPIFRHNNNLFGMKKAQSRPTTNLGIKRGHAYYKNWESSVEDYAYYQAYFGFSKVNSDEAYYNLLNQRGYAQDPNYILKVKKLAEELKHKF